MQEQYDFRAIEKKWQEHWEREQRYSVSEDPSKRKFYVLEMLPYPSGALHMGHVRNYSLGDSLARFKRMQGYNVLHPLGWDAFGLPAENAAIRHGVPPERWTLDNIRIMKKQAKEMGWSYDWDREITTCLPDYYKWNQWFFLQMYKKGLAYRRSGQVNWCEKCQTVLANEQVVNGRCWRDDSVVLQTELEQWYWRITQYAEELLQDLDKLGGWPEKVRSMQQNWIGKSSGTRVRFEIEGEQEAIEIFTTRVDTIYGATFVLLAPEHSLVRRWVDDPQHGPALTKFAEAMKWQDRAARTAEEGEKLGVFTGHFAINPFSNEKVPIWVANFVLMEYGTGAIMAVPAHDQRDFEFARKYQLPVRVVICPVSGELSQPLETAFSDYGQLVQSGPFSGLTSEFAQEKMAAFAGERGFGSPAVSYRLKDWGISRQRYWGTPIPILYCPRCGTVPVREKDLPVVLPKTDQIRLGGSPLATVPEFVNTTCHQCGGNATRETDTMDTFVDSSWYFYRYTAPRLDAAAVDRAAVCYWFPVDQYIGGIEHAILHLIYMRFFTKVMRDMGLVDFNEPVTNLFTQGMVIREGGKMSKSRGNVVAPDEMVRAYGADALRLFIQFAAPPERDLDWNEQGLEGCYRFVNRLWRLVYRFHGRWGTDVNANGIRKGPESRALERKLHQTIRKVTDDLERFHQNTAIAAIMELLNELYPYTEGDAEPRLVKEVLGKMTLLISPFAPHVAEEIGEILGHTESLDSAGWPSYDPELAREEEIEIVIQVNGKIRSKFSAPAGITESEMETAALSDEKVKSYLTDRRVQKVITVPKKLVNIVVR
ncbi:MAG: leucine--tRNA ligase [Acidobacteria bacterium]|nr:leucine--tRNA ligase [Acidobacteriota bacterium]